MISAFLLPAGGNRSPARLHTVSGLFTQGTNIRSPGFLFGDDGEPNSLDELRNIEATSPNEMRWIFPYLGGEEVNATADQAPRRYVINVNHCDTEEQLRALPALHSIIREKVKPERDQLNTNPNNRKLKQRWWCYHAERRKFYTRIHGLNRVLVNSQVSPHLAFVSQQTGRIWGHTLNIFALAGEGPFAAMQSRPHEVWARFFASTLEDRLRYTPSDCFATFPFPPSFETDATLEVIGQAYHDHRAALMIRNNEGLTKTYNRFHDPAEDHPEIVKLRELHDAMDRAVLTAYGWTDLAERIATDPDAKPRHLTEDTEDDHKYQGRYFWPAPIRDEVLARLLAENVRRAEQEREAGLELVPTDEPEDEANTGEEEAA